MLSVLDSCLRDAGINVILTWTYFSLNSGAAEAFSLVNPFYYSIIANKNALTTLAELAGEFAEADYEDRYTSFVSHGGRKRPAYVLVLHQSGKSYQLFQYAELYSEYVTLEN